MFMPVMAVEQNRQGGNQAQKQSADQSDLGNHLGDKLGGGSAGTNARNRAIILLQIIGHFHRVILNRHIEVVKA